MKGNTMSNVIAQSNTTINAAEFAHAMPGPVVKNDTAAPDSPSIKLDSLGVPVTLTVGSTSTAVPQGKLAAMEQARPDGQVKFPHPWPPQIPPGRTGQIMTTRG